MLRYKAGKEKGEKTSNHIFSQVCTVMAAHSQCEWVLKETDDLDLCFLPLKPFIMGNEGCECVNFLLYSESERSHKVD